MNSEQNKTDLEKLSANLEEIIDEHDEREISLPLPLRFELMSKAAAPEPVRCGFYGRSNAGKSTALEKILGIPILRRPIELTAAAGTQCILEFIAHTDAKRTDYFMHLELVSIENWSEMFEAAKADIAAWRNNDDEDAELSSTTIWLEHVMTGTSKTTFQRSSHRFQVEDYENVQAWPYFQTFMIRKDELIQGVSGCTQPDELRIALINILVGQFENPIDDYDDSDVSFVGRVETPCWPFIHKASLYGPFKLLRDLNITLIDLPGVNDGNVILTERAIMGLKLCSRVFYMPGGEAIFNEENHKALNFIDRAVPRAKKYLLVTKIFGQQAWLALAPERLQKRLEAECQRHFPEYPLVSCFGVENGDERYGHFWNFFFEWFKNTLMVEFSK